MNKSFFETKPSVDNIDFSDKYYQCFKNFKIEDMPNFIFYGNKGSGKTTKIYAFLCSLLDNRVYSLKNNEVEVDKRIFKFKSSIYHLEIDCFELVNNEKIFFSGYLKEYVQTRNIGLDLPKIIYITNIDKISHNSFLFLRKLIESNYQSSKFIFETNNLGIIPNVLLTRFMQFRVKNPKRDIIETVLKKEIKENKVKITKKNLNKIIDFDKNYKSYYDLNNIFIAYNYYLKTGKILVDNYHNIINEIIGIITTKKQKFSNLIFIKGICEKIFINCYDVYELVVSINKILVDLNKDNPEKCHKILELSLEADINLHQSTGKYFIHLENYFVKLIILLSN